MSLSSFNLSGPLLFLFLFSFLFSFLFLILLSLLLFSFSFQFLFSFLFLFLFLYLFLYLLLFLFYFHILDEASIQSEFVHHVVQSSSPCKYKILIPVQDIDTRCDYDADCDTRNYVMSCVATVIQMRK